jgi:hypothetical protein
MHEIYSQSLNLKTGELTVTDMVSDNTRVRKYQIFPTASTKEEIVIALDNESSRIKCKILDLIKKVNND